MNPVHITVEAIRIASQQVRITIDNLTDNISEKISAKIDNDDKLVTAFYHYDECGLYDIYLLNGYRTDSTPYGDGVAVEDEDELLHLIAMSLIRRRPTLMGRELRFLRRRMDMTQAELAKVLRTDVQTVARWEKGQSKISGPADGLVRFVYLLETGESIDEKFLEQITDLDVDDSLPLILENTDGGWVVIGDDGRI